MGILRGKSALNFSKTKNRNIFPCVLQED
ncbi:conserved hypothetical protein [Agrobacterium genomosp. 5 str. CFBP 6626]|nr:conserved hypothetical protein [Agrobacterium genomosp. 5 str. CFBP 6626]